MSNGISETERVCPLDYDVFCGLDVDKRTFAVTYMDHGLLMQSLTIAYDPLHLVNYTRKHFSDKRVVFAYEAGPTGYGLCDRLREAGYACLVVSPATIPREPGCRVKTNRLDSKKLARALRGGELRGIRVPRGVYRELRQLVQLRQVHVRQVRGYKCRIKALLLLEGLCFPEGSGSDQWPRWVMRALQELPCTAAVRFKLDRLLETLEFHREQALRAQREIRRFCESEADLADSIRYLMSLPGVGWIIASMTLARIGDWRELRRAQEIGAFMGLVPTENTTGDRVRKGSITKAGDPVLRSMLIEGAWTAIRKDSELRALYQRVYQRHPRDRAARKAIVAVARKLTLRMYSVLKERRFYVMSPLSK